VTEQVTCHTSGEHRARWLASGAIALAAMEQAIDAAVRSVRLETYIFRAVGPGERLRSALIRAADRGVSVQVLIDSYGSEGLAVNFFDGLVAAGGDARMFNPAQLLRLSIRDHRKLLLCDETIAIVGGLNIGPEYDGDGVNSGWRDLALHLEGPIAQVLAQSFDRMFGLAPFSRPALRAFARHARRPLAGTDGIRVLTGGPGARGGELRRIIREDLRSARVVRIVAGYFLPPNRIRRELGRIHRRGGDVKVLVAGNTDVAIAKLAGRHLYPRLLASGVRIFEYRPQILHAKLLVLDDTVYVGSCNFDIRSLHINYELLLRLHWPGLATDARALFENDLTNSAPMDAERLRNELGWWERIRAAGAYWALARLDPLISQRQLRGLG
jgi:cardiolipin synthase